LESKKGLQNFQQTRATSPLDFYRERGSIVIENEHGWANYFIMGETGYLQNMYIYPTSRRSQNGTLMLSNIELSMSEIYGCKKIMTTISRLWGDAEKTLQISLKRGFKLASLTDDAIFLIKEL
jgi:hypothetical protein